MSEASRIGRSWGHKSYSILELQSGGAAKRDQRMTLIAGMAAPTKSSSKTSSKRISLIHRVDRLALNKGFQVICGHLHWIRAAFVAQAICGVIEQFLA